MSELFEKRELYLKGKNDHIGVSMDLVSCECGFLEEEGSMVHNLYTYLERVMLIHTKVRCDCCDKLQHQHCYGLDFLGSNEIHACYTCLLTEKEPEILQKLEGVANLRRAFWFVRRAAGPRGDVEFSKDIGKTSLNV